MNMKRPSESAVETRYIVMPEHTNQYGTAFGGVLLSWIDIAAAMVAERHSGHNVVTASIDRTEFLKPIYVGDHVLLKASVNYVGRTSMEIGVKVLVENPFKNSTFQATKAYCTFVGLNDNNKPRELPGIDPQSEEEKRRYENARLRVNSRKELRSRLK
jgi:uncharacterized protein (TIGR00369 family)